MNRIAIDAMGGDSGPAPIIQGTLEALRCADFKAVLVGKQDEIAPLIPYNMSSRIEICHANDVISMQEHATDALKKKDSSIYVATQLVRDKLADALVSAGHSGATMSLATLRIGRIDCVLRPAIATFMPTVDGGQTLVLDVGANVDSKPEHLLQFAVMGRVYAQKIMGLRRVKVGLLANGEEEGKGNDVTKEALRLMKQLPEFIGNVEGNNIFDGSVHVVVCDGFVGNIVLKTSEGVADTIGKFMKNNIKKSAFASFGAVFLRSVFGDLKRRIDYAEVGGAPLLGVNGAVIVSHGKSNAKAIKNAVMQAQIFANSGFLSSVTPALKEFN
jgi:glycerol-3-phosphate acyltransferase PlsX